MSSGVAPDRPGRNAGRFFRGSPFSEDLSPVITSVSPASSKLAGGGTITITGRSFNVDTAGTPTVSIGGTVATNVVVVNQNTITATIPAHIAGLVSVLVIDTRGRLGAAENAFSYVDSVIISVAPGSGVMSGGTVVRISGVGFVPGATITFGGIAATSITYIDDSHYVVTTPPHSGGPVVVSVNDASIQGGYFYTLELPGSTFRRNPSVHISHSSNGPSTCTYTIDGQTGIPPKAGEEIEIRDQFVNELFSGVAMIVDQQYEELPENLVWNVSATDYVVWLNKRRPVGTYVQTSATDVIYDICSRFAPWVDLDFVQTELAQIDIAFDGSKKFSECLNDVAALLGRTHWRMDRKELHFFRVPAPKVSSNARPVKEIGVGPGTAPLASLSASIKGGFSYAAGYYAFRSSFLYGDGSYGTTVSGTNAAGSTTLTIFVSGTPHPLLRGTTITITSGAAAGIYLVREDTPIQLGLNNVPLAYGLKGATSGSEPILVIVSESNPSPMSNLALMDGVHFPRLDNIAVGVSVGALTIVGRRIYFTFFGLDSAVDLGFYTEIPDNGTTTIVTDGFSQTVQRGVPRLPVSIPPLGPQSAPTLMETAQLAKDVLAAVIPRVGTLTSYTFQAGSYVVFITNVYADGTVSRSSPPSNLLALTGKYALTVAAPTGQPINGVPVVYREIYGSRSGKTSEFVDTGATTFWGVIPDNTSSWWTFTPGLKKVGDQKPALPGTGVDSDPSNHVDGPNPEDGSHPAEINDGNSYRLVGKPQLSSSDDVTEIYNRVVVVGRGVEIAPPVVLPPPAPNAPTVISAIDPYANSASIYADGTTPTAYIASHPDLQPWQSGYPMNGRWTQLQKNYAAQGTVTTQTATPSSGGSAGAATPMPNTPDAMWWDFAYGVTGGAPNRLGGTIPMPPWRAPATPSGTPETVTTTSSDGVDHFKQYLASAGITPQFMLDHPYTVFMDLPENYYEAGGGAGAAGATSTIVPTIESLNDNAVQPITPTITRPMYQVDDIESQRYFGTLEKDSDGNATDGVHEIYLDGSSLPSGSACIAYANAFLTLHAWPVVTVRYAVRETGHKPGRLPSFNLTKPPLKGTFAIQSVDISQIRDESDELTALYTVTASSIKFDLNDLLALIGGSSVQPPLGVGASPLSIVTAVAAARSEAKQIAATAVKTGAAVRMCVVVLNDAQIKALNTTPVVLIPAPGANSLIIPISQQVICTQDTIVPWTNSRDATIRYAGTTSNLANGPAISFVSTGHFEMAVAMLNPTGLGLDLRNKAVEIVNLSTSAGPAGATAGPPGGATTIAFAYAVIDAS